MLLGKLLLYRKPIFLKETNQEFESSLGDNHLELLLKNTK